jgi:lysophospholipase L1-like esterase
VLFGSIVGLGTVEVALRLLEARAGSLPESRTALDAQLAASETAPPGSGGTGRFSLYGLVQASPHREVVYELKPLVEGTFRGQPLVTNALGHRQRTTPALQKPPGVFRVVGLGDSHMFGWGVAQGETYLELLQQSLEARGRRVEVLNCAAPGYNTAMEVALYEHECAAYQPDLVVLHWIGNDFDYPHFLRSVTDSPEPASASPPRWRWHTLEALTRLAAKGTEGNGPEPGDARSEMDPEALPDLLPHTRRTASKAQRRTARAQYAESVGRDGVKRAFTRLAELTRPAEIPVVVLILGTGDEGRQMVAQTAQLLGFEVVDAAPWFSAALVQRGLPESREIWREQYILPDDGHPTATAHRVYAEVLESVVWRLIESGGAGSPDG